MLPDNLVCPAPLRAILGRLPQFPPTWLFVAGLNALLKPRLPDDFLAALAGKPIRLNVIDVGMTLNFMLTAQGFRALGARHAPQLAVSASAQDFMRLALKQEDADTLFFKRRLLMEGDTELGLLIKNTLDTVVL